MKKLNILLVLALLSICSLYTHAQAPTNGLVAYYPFNGNANDASGNNRDGVISGTVTTTTDRNGEANKAYELDNDADRITISNWQILTGNAERSISVWFKTESQFGHQWLVDWGAWAWHSASHLGTYVGLNGMGFVSYSNYNCYLANPTAYYDNQWHHMLFTYENRHQNLYLDGILIVSNDKQSDLTTPATNLEIGRGFHGAIDDVRIYNRALSRQEAQSVYISEVGSTYNTEIVKIGSDNFIHIKGEKNTFVGLRSANINSGFGNSFIGFETGIRNTSGSRNTFVGTESGYNNLGGDFNTLLGNGSGTLNTSGSSNTFLGYFSGYSNQGSNNVGVGNNAGLWTGTGNQNTFVGNLAGIGSQLVPNLGSNNTFLGTESGRGNSIGNSNTFLGQKAGAAEVQNGAGSYNTFVGAKTGGYLPLSTSLQRSGAFGYNARVSKDDAIVIGDFENDNLRVGIGLHDPLYPLDVKGVINMRAAYNSPGLKMNGQDFMGIDEEGKFWVSNFKMIYSTEGEWADRVFEVNYSLKPIEEVAKYAMENKHLPNMPHASEVVENGVSIQIMVSKLLEKVEELTLYTHSNKKEIDKLKRENQKLKLELEEFKTE